VRERNRRTFEASDVVRFYASRIALQPPEQTILDRLRPRLATMAMLDIGVGGGRTTRHFASLVRAYTGIDYARPMLDACRAVFSAPNTRFALADAKRLPFADDEFDFVLFSYNGLDCCDHDDRLSALAEVRRVARPGAVFAFSTHNLLSLAEFFAFRGSWNPLKAADRLLRWARLRINNAPTAQMCSVPCSVVRDGSFGFRGVMYHIRPQAQVEQLEACGFERVEAFSLATGVPLAPTSLPTATDRWLYFTCAVGDKT
jgi:SAM-dependent methyltransferase